MPKINTNSILEKAKSYTSSAEFQKRIGKKTDEIVLTGSGKARAASGKMIANINVSEAAGKFIEVLQNEIRSLEANSGFAEGRLGHTAVTALEKLTHGSPVKIGENKYQIAVWFSDNLYRDSLAPDEFEGINNIAALLNKGYTTKSGKPVYGVWMGHSGNFNIASLPQRSGAQFIQNAIRNYMVNYAADYGVIDIDIGDIYK